MEKIKKKDEWRFLSMANGEQFAMMDGPIKMQLWSVGSLVTSKEAPVLWDGAWWTLLWLIFLTFILMSFLSVKSVSSIKNINSMVIWNCKESVSSLVIFTLAFQEICYHHKYSPTLTVHSAAALGHRHSGQLFLWCRLEHWIPSHWTNSWFLLFMGVKLCRAATNAVNVNVAEASILPFSVSSHTYEYLSFLVIYSASYVFPSAFVCLCACMCVLMSLKQPPS